MQTFVTMPQLPAPATEGTITAWLKKPGDIVAVGQPLFRTSAGTAEVEITAPADGILTEIRVGEGGKASAGALVAIIAITSSQAKTSIPSQDLAPEDAFQRPRPSPGIEAFRTFLLYFLVLFLVLRTASLLIPGMKVGSSVLYAFITSALMALKTYIFRKRRR